MEFVEVQNIVLPLRILAVTFLLCIFVSGVYFEYLKGGKSWKVLFQFFAMLPILISITGLMYIAVSSAPLTNFLFLLILLFVLLLFLGKMPRFKCVRKDRIGEFEGLPIFICHEKKKVYNAWFDVKRKEINFTKSLFDILTEEERKTVLYHEIGHSKSKLWNFTVRGTLTLWLFSVSLILTMFVLIWFFSPYPVFQKILHQIIFILFLPMYAISFMISSWINEHEADIHAVKAIGFKPMAIALVKIHVYDSLRDFEEFITKVEFSYLFKVNGISYFDVLKAIIKRVFVYLSPQTVMNQPLPETHPPLRLRLEKVFRFSSKSQ